MSVIMTLAGKDIKDALRNRSTYIYVAFMFLIAFPYLDGLRTTLNTAAAQAPGASLLPVSREFLGGTASTLPLTLSMLFCTYLSAYAIVLEKAKRTLESLLATPASLRQVWVGKSVAVALPGIVVTLFVLIVAVIVLNLLAIVPMTGTFVMPPPAAIATGFILVPLLTLEIVGAVSLLQLIVSNPRVANFAFVALFFGFYFLTVTGVSSSWDFEVIYLATLVALAGANVFLSRFLTKERVVLSSKG